MKRFAVFDIDGTLIRWQLYHAVVDRMAKHSLLGKDAHEKLHEARMIWKRREHLESFRQYESTLIGIYESALAHIDTKTFDILAEEVASEYEDQVYTYTRDLIDQLREQNYVLLAISGSHDELVAHIARKYGFTDWAGTRYERKGNHFTGKKFVASNNKEEILANFITKYKLSKEDSYAVGDSMSDMSMLQMVDHPIAFNPDRYLLHVAKQEHWTIVMERKNVIYTLLPNGDDGYNLVT